MIDVQERNITLMTFLKDLHRMMTKSQISKLIQAFNFFFLWKILLFDLHIRAVKWTEVRVRGLISTWI